MDYEITPFIEALLRAGNLSENQAKTIVYYCIITHSDTPQIRPILNINGESGTGKNTIMRQIQPWCREPKWINARNITSAQLRDELADTTTAFIEEADKVQNLREAENWYQHRYEITGADISYRRQALTTNQRSIYVPETHNHFGYTVIHTQNPFTSTEMDRRILRVTLQKDTTRDYQNTEVVEDAKLWIVAADMNWAKEIEGIMHNTAWDVWLPLIRVADHLEDGEFIEYAKQQIEAKAEEDALTMIYEPRGIVLGEIAELYETALLDFGRRQYIPITEIRAKTLERGSPLIERQIVGLARELNFTIAYRRNKAHVRVVSPENLQIVLETAGLRDTAEEDPPAREIETTAVS